MKGLLAGIDADEQVGKGLLLSDYADFEVVVQGEDGEKGDKEWQVAKMWNEVLVEKGVVRPSTVPSTAEARNVFWFVQEVCPRRFLSERWVGKWTKE